MQLDPAALSALKNSQRQLDADGCEVGVSRQALDELLAAYDALASRAEPVRVNELEGAAKLCAICGNLHDNDLLSDICVSCETDAPWREDATRSASHTGEAVELAALREELACEIEERIRHLGDDMDDTGRKRVETLRALNAGRAEG